MRLDPNLALGLRMTRKHLDDARAAIDRYNQREPSSSRRGDFEARRRQIAALADQADELASELGAAEVADDPQARPEFDSHFATLTHNLNRMRRPLRGESGQIAQQLRDDEETSLQIALGLGGVGLLIGRGGLRDHPAHAAAAAALARARAAGRGRRLRPANGRRRTTRSASWCASSTPWRRRSRSASSG